MLAGEVEQRSHARSHRKVSPGSAHHSRVPSGSLPDPQNNYHDYHHVIKLIIDRARYKGARVGSRSRFLALRERIDYSIKFPGREGGGKPKPPKSKRGTTSIPRVFVKHTQYSQVNSGSRQRNSALKEKKEENGIPPPASHANECQVPGQAGAGGINFNTLIFASSQRKRNWKL